ncbi:MAG: Gfo/Idh/MocA family oxidoreductase [Phycisphaerales bacterium]|nr:Gfo/Idh/MocA family oxidoreductase [Phycisphaerales bacterium]
MPLTNTHPESSLDTTATEPVVTADGNSRREFLKHGLAVAGMAVVGGLAGCASPGKREPGPRWASSLPAARPLRAPRREQLRIAFIATGGIGGHHLETTKEAGILCPCYCDVDTQRMDMARELYPAAKAYQDYRRLFEEMGSEFDAVMIGTPDHHHYPATMLALQMGKHVYLQKPLTHTVWEARQLTEAAARYGLATQMGNQGHALEGWRLVYEYVHSGVLGDIVETHTWSDRPIWPQGMGRPEGESPVPAHVDWDLWLGPAPERPYVEKVYHPFTWRGWWDFGTGALGDMACHTMDGIFWALDPGYPTSVEPVASSAITEEAFPNAAVVRWDFPKRGKRKAFSAYWYDGGLRPTTPAVLEYGRRIPPTGSLFIGTDAALVVSGDYGSSSRIIPEARMKEVGKPPQLLERSPGHVEEWLLACSGLESIDFPKSRFAYSGPMCETVLLGNVALRVGRRLEWDGANLRITNVPEANAFLTKEYRAGWRV